MYRFGRKKTTINIIITPLYCCRLGIIYLGAVAVADERLIIITGGVPREQETPSFYANRMKSLPNPFSPLKFGYEFTPCGNPSVLDSKSDKSKSTQT